MTRNTEEVSGNYWEYLRITGVTGSDGKVRREWCGVRQATAIGIIDSRKQL